MRRREHNISNRHARVHHDIWKGHERRSNDRRELRIEPQGANCVLILGLYGLLKLAQKEDYSCLCSHPGWGKLSTNWRIPAWPAYIFKMHLKCLLDEFVETTSSRRKHPSAISRFSAHCLVLWPALSYTSTGTSNYMKYTDQYSGPLLFLRPCTSQSVPHSFFIPLVRHTRHHKFQHCRCERAKRFLMNSVGEFSPSTAICSCSKVLDSRILI